MSTATTAHKPATAPVDPTTLWGSDEGRIACEKHLGGYATAIRREFPRRRVLKTPLDTWRRVTAVDAADFEKHVGEPMSCETCRFEQRR